MVEAREIDWDADVVVDPAESYQSLVRSLQRTEGFGLFFVRCVPGDQADLVHRLQADLPRLHMQRLDLTAELVDGNLYQRVAALPDVAEINVLFISGLEKSLDPYVKAGYGGQGDYYKLDTVPRVLGHLNLQRERFRDDFPFCLVFLLSAFGIKYIARRAPDFFDWRSGLFEFVPDAATVSTLTQELRGNYQEYLTWSHSQRLDRLREIQAILEEDQQTPEQQASLWLEKGNILAADQNYEAAIASYDQAFEFKPDKHEAWYNRGLALSALGHQEEAIASYDQALGHKPDDDKAWYARGVAMSNLGRKEEAIASYDRALEIKPDDHAAWRSRGDALAELGRKEAAIANYDRALEIKPDYDEAWNSRGYTFFELGQYAKAISSFKKALQIKQGDDKVLSNLAAALGSLGQREEAITYCDKALASNPDNENAWFDRGISLSALGRKEEAIASYDQALAIKPDDHQAWSNRGLALSTLGRYKEAIASYDQAIAHKPDKHEAWNNRRAALFALGRYKEAIASGMKAIQILQELDAPLADMPYPTWIKSALRFAQRGKLETALLVAVVIVLAPFYLGWLLLFIPWQLLRNEVRRSKNRR